MRYQRRTIFILSSCALSVLLIGTAYINSGPSFFSAKTAGAESTHDLLVSYASKDSDNDGLPDWQEALYGTDPNNAHSVSPTLTDSQAVTQGLVQPKFKTATSTPADASTIPGPTAGPETITDQFSKDLFGQYLKARVKGQPTSAEIATFVDQGVAQLKQNHVTPDAFNQGQVKVSGTGPDALLVYAADAEKALTKKDTTTRKTELDYFADAVHKNDPAALTHVQKDADNYAAAGRALMKVNVPKELAATHLEIANSLMQISESVSDMAALSKDPIRAMLGMTTYSDNLVRLVKALAIVNAVYKAEGVVPPIGTTGSLFYKDTVTSALGNK